jgi:hypothetical protein
MNSFAPLFRSLVDSSLAREPDFVFKAYMMLLSLKDSDQISRITAFGLGSKCWPLEPEKSEQRAIDAIKILSEPDKKRIEPQPYDGRRIERVEGGWLILNGQKYEDEMRAINRRVYKARKEREYRALKKGLPLDGEVQHEAAIRNGASVEETDAIVVENLPTVAEFQKAVIEFLTKPAESEEEVVEASNGMKVIDASYQESVIKSVTRPE